MKFDRVLYKLVLTLITITDFFFFFSNSGIYGDGITLKTLKDFHRRRVQILADSGADLIAFETVPNKIEAQVS